MTRFASQPRRLVAAAAVALAVAAPLGLTASAHGPELGDDHGGFVPAMPSAPVVTVGMPAVGMVFDDHGFHPEFGDDHGMHIERGDDHGGFGN